MYGDGVCVSIKSDSAAATSWTVFKPSVCMSNGFLDAFYVSLSLSHSIPFCSYSYTGACVFEVLEEVCPCQVE